MYDKKKCNLYGRIAYNQVVIISSNDVSLLDLHMLYLMYVIVI